MNLNWGKKLITTATILAVSAPSIASENTDAKFASLVKKYKLDAPTQSYCYTNERGEIEGINTNLKVRLASVSKLVTSLWAMETLGPDYRYQTKLYIKDNQLHIEGSWDPFFGNEKVFFLLSQLNDLGYESFDKVTYDKNLIIFPGAQFYVGEHPAVGPITTGTHLKTYLNTAKWGQVFKDEYKRIQGLTKRFPEETRIRESVQFSVNEIKNVDVNPFKDDPSVKVLTLSSPELKDYLKETNVKSNNYSSQMIFRGLGGDQKLQEFIQKTFGLKTDKFRIYTGSGLPMVANGVRYDNFASCEIIANVVETLKEVSERKGSSLNAIMAVPGADQGTFRRRLNGTDTANSFMAKTGTLMHTSTLAGALSTKTGLSFFGVFNQTSDIVSAKSLQDQMVFTLLQERGGVSKFPYNPEPFYTVDADVRVKGYGHEEASDFLPFDAALK